MNGELMKIAEEWVKSFNASRPYHFRFASLSDISPDGLEALGKLIKQAEKVERLEEYIGQLKHENNLLYGRLNNIIALASKEIK